MEAGTVEPATQGASGHGGEISPVVAEANARLAERPLLTLPYFERLVNGSMTRAQFVRSQEQFFFAVRFFSRPMAALVSRLPDSARRMNLVHNLAEEQGDFIPARAHDRTFAAFLASLGARHSEAREGPEVQAFNHALLGVCLGGDVGTALGCLGIIEYAFADISALIGRAVVDCGWVHPSKLVHYNLHAEIDKRHAEEFFSLVEPDWKDAAQQRLIIQGLALGRHVFARLYEDLNTLASDHDLG